MKAPEGPVLRIPVVLAASFEGGKFTAKNGLLSNKASNGQSVKDLSGATLQRIRKEPSGGERIGPRASGQPGYSRRIELYDHPGG